MEGINKFISENLKNRIDTNSLRTLKPENDLIDFCSNDYLGFAHSIAFKQMFEAEIKKYPNYQMGSGGSRLLAGNDRFTENLENEIIRLCGSKGHRAWSKTCFYGDRGRCYALKPFLWNQ